MAGEVVPPTVAEHDGWEVHSASVVDPVKPEQIVERLTDVPGDEQIEQRAAQVAKEEQKAKATEEAADPATEEQKPEEKKKQSASQRNAELRARIAAETRAYHDARRAREFEQSELLRIRKEREELETKNKPASQDKPAPKGDKPVWAKYEEDGKSYEEFLDARAEYDRQQTVELTRADLKKIRDEDALKARQHAEQQAATRAEREHATRMDAAAQKYEDFFEIIDKNLSDVPDAPYLVDLIQNHKEGAEVLYHLAKNPDEAKVLSSLSASRPIMDALRFSEQPIEMLSYFGQHPQELDRLNRLHPASALVALGELKAQFKAAKDGSATNEQVSNAKPPIRPVGGGRTSTPKDPDDLPFGPEWIRAENKRDRERKKASAYF